MDLIEKYKPKSMSDIVGNKKQAIMIKEWLKQYYKPKNDKNSKENKERKKKKLSIEDCSSIIITGPHGVGKTVAIEVAAKQAGFIFENVKTSTKNDNLEADTDNIMNLLNNKNTKTVKVIDEIESISSPQDKAHIISLLKKNSDAKMYPIVLISNGQHNKFLTEIKKLAFEVKFYKPFDSEIKKVISVVSKGENIKFQSMDTVNDILQYCKSDIRKLIFLMRDLKNISGKASISQKNFESYKLSSQSKDIDFNLFDSADNLLFNYKDIDSALNHFESQTVLLPLMVHQYYTDVIISNFDNEDKRFELARDVAESLSIGDVVENQIYGDQNWKAREIHGFYTCVNTSYNLCKDRSSLDPEKVKMVFPKDLNKTSIKKINRKNIDKTGDCIINKSIIDYIYISKIVKQLIKNGRYEECSQLLKPHGMKMEHIESLLKIEKIQSRSGSEDGKEKTSKPTLTTKQKKDLQEFLEKV